MGPSIKFHWISLVTYDISNGYLQWQSLFHQPERNAFLVIQKWSKMYLKVISLIRSLAGCNVRCLALSVGLIGLVSRQTLRQLTRCKNNFVTQKNPLDLKHLTGFTSNGAFAYIYVLHHTYHHTYLTLIPFGLNSQQMLFAWTHPKTCSNFDLSARSGGFHMD